MQSMKKRALGQQLLLSQLRGMIIFDRRELRPLGLIEGAIFRRENLQLAFLECLVAGETNFIRSDQTAVVDNLLTAQGIECFGEKADFIRDKVAFSDNCRLISYKVCDTNGSKIGQVEDCAVKLPLMHMDRIYVRRPLLKSFKQSLLVIQASTISDVIPDKKLIIIQSEMRSFKKTAIKPATA